MTNVETDAGAMDQEPPSIVSGRILEPANQGELWGRIEMALMSLLCGLV
jgi:hypothetical protein